MNIPISTGVMLDFHGIYSNSLGDYDWRRISNQETVNYAAWRKNLSFALTFWGGPPVCSALINDKNWDLFFCNLYSDRPFVVCERPAPGTNSIGKIN